MNPSPDNLARHELIGLNVSVVDATNETMNAIEGLVIDETRNLLVIETDSGDKKVPKTCASFIFHLKGQRSVKVAGQVLISQPENRISKRMLRSRWKL